MLRSVDDLAGNLPQQLSSLVGREDAGRRGRRARPVEPAGHAERRRRRRQDPAGPRGRRRGSPASSPTACGSSSWRRSATRRSVPAAIATALGITPQGDAPLIDDGRRCAGRAGALLVLSTTASTSWPPAASAHRDDPRAVRDRPGPRHVARGPRGRRRDGARPCRRWRWTAASTSDAVTLFVDRARAVRPDFGLEDPRPAAAVTEICETARRAPAGHRAGGGADGRDERGRGPGPARRPVPAAAGLGAGPGAPAHAAPRGGVVLRPADRRRAAAAPHQRRCSPAAST